MRNLERNAQLSRAVGAVIRTRREAVGMSQKALAIDADEWPTHTSMLERGLRRPTLATLEAYGAVLGCAVSDLIRDAETLLSVEVTP